ncbi:MAG: putative toxin-antitoxin system toxin component, PIN family [Deltaproteobacteria bacterium]|nr:putative toxin-antitoxin system toxin component, PIN family [Deltaproteobacteria bacterium]
MKIVLDTNVIISGFLFPGGAPDKIVRAVLAGTFQNATSPDLLTELKRVLKKKFHLPEAKLGSMVNLIAEASEIVYPLERLDVIKSDLSDNRVLECAETAKAAIIVTGDTKHLTPT